MHRMCEGFGFTFTIGRGNDICVLAAQQRAKPLIGRERRGARRRPRRHLPRAEVGLPAALARPGEGGRAPRARRGDERPVGSRCPPGRQAAVAAARRHVTRAAGRRGRPAVPVRRADARRGDRDPGRAGTDAGRADRRARRIRLPLLHDERRLARLLRRQAAAAVPGSGGCRLSPREAEGRRDRWRTTSVAAGSPAR